MTHRTYFRGSLALAASLLFGCAEEPIEDDWSGDGAGAAERVRKAREARKSRNKAQSADEEDEDLGPPRPPVALDSRSFSRKRDPFKPQVATETVIAEPAPIRANRKVKLAQYSFEELKLIAIVNSGRGITPRALFLASGNKSKTIKQGEYFSSAEVLLAAVNRDYIEIEVVDDDLASSLNLQRGERRAIYLRND